MLIFVLLIHCLLIYVMCPIYIKKNLGSRLIDFSDYLITTTLNFSLMNFYKLPYWDNRKAENQIKTSWVLHNPNLTKSVKSL